MKRMQTLAQLRKEYAEVHSCATATDRWIAYAIMYLIDQGVFDMPRGTPRPVTAYNRFFGEGMKAGKTPAQIGAEWMARSP